MLFLNYRKSQAEAFGLILIVALVFVIFAIMARIEQGRSSTDLKSTFESTELSSGTMNTMLNTITRHCYGKTFSEIIIDCIRNQNSLCEGGVLACNYFIQESTSLLNEVFTRAHLDYYMRINVDGRARPEVFDGEIPPDSDCSANLRGEDFILPLNPGTLVITLIVCRT